MLSLCFHIFSNLYFGPTPSFFFLLHESKSVLRLKPMNFLPLSFNLYAISNLYFGPTPSFKMRPRISMRGCVRPSVGRSVTLSFRLAENEQKWSELTGKQSKTLWNGMVRIVQNTSPSPFQRTHFI